MRTTRRVATLPTCDLCYRAFDTGGAPHSALCPDCRRPRGPVFGNTSIQHGQPDDDPWEQNNVRSLEDGYPQHADHMSESGRY